MLFSKPKLADLSVTLTRDELIRRSRILIIDDEEPRLRADLEQAGFSVGYMKDVDKAGLQLLEKMLYDLVILDFSGVGRTLGKDEGLAILRHLKRVNPSVIVLSYTSKPLFSGHADFYRLTDGVLAKDAGIGDSLEIIENALRKSMSLDNLWRGLLVATGIVTGSKTDTDLQAKFVQAVRNGKKKKALADYVAALLNSDEAKAAAMTVLGKLIELGAKALAGGGGQ